MKNIIFIAFFLSNLNMLFAQTTQADTNLYLFKKNDGSEYIGKLLSDDGREILIVTEKLGKIYIPKSEINSIVVIKDKGVINGSKTVLIDYYTLGTQDARKYYKIPPQVIVGEVICGATALFLFPVIPALIIKYYPPQMIHALNNPNDTLLTTVPDYRKGYEIGMKKKKRKAATISFFSSFIPGFVIIGGWISKISWN
jgi:hypothetical protein